MAVFVIFLDNVARPTPAAIARHVDHLRALDDVGQLIVCGPFADGDGGLVCVHAASEADARAVAEADPFVALGFKRCRVRALDVATRENGYLLVP